MILPDKNITLEYSLLGCGAWILMNMRPKESLSSLWKKAKEHEGLMNYEKFILTLDYLYIIGAIDFKDGILRRKRDA